MSKKNEGLGYNLSDYGDYETSPFNYDDRISDYMNSKVGGNRKYRLQRIAELNDSIAMERNYLPEQFSVGGFSTGSTNPNAHYPLGVALPGWQKGMPNPNLAAQPVEGIVDEKPNWTFYKDKNFKDQWGKSRKVFKEGLNEIGESLSGVTGSAFQKYKSLPLKTQAALIGAGLIGLAGNFLNERQQENNYKINKKINTF